MAQCEDSLRVPPPTNCRLKDCHQYEQWQVVEPSISSKWQQMVVVEIAPDHIIIDHSIKTVIKS